LGLLLIVAFQIGCQVKDNLEIPSESKGSSTSKYLYFSSGACSVGNLTASKPYSATQSGFLGRIDVAATNPSIETVYDYSSVFGEFPVGIASFDSDRLIVGVETNAANRRIDLVAKKSVNNASGWASGSGSLTTVFSTVFRKIAPALGVTGQGDAGTVNGYLISRSASMEKVTLTKQRQFPLNAPAAAWINAPGAACATSTTLISDMIVTPNGKIIYSHSLAAQNRLGVINGLGYGASVVATADCLSGMASPDTTNSFPSAMVYVLNSGGTGPQILVYYSSSVQAKDYLYRYDYNDTTGVISGGTLLYQNAGYLRGVSAMAYDNTSNELYLANGSTLLPNSIEKFKYDPVNFNMTRVMGANGQPFIPASMNTPCINTMIIDN
jgi:hypothetical protein